VVDGYFGASGGIVMTWGISRSDAAGDPHRAAGLDRGVEWRVGHLGVRAQYRGAGVVLQRASHSITGTTMYQPVDRRTNVGSWVAQVTTPGGVVSTKPACWRSARWKTAARTPNPPR